MIAMGGLVEVITQTRSPTATMKIARAAPGDLELRLATSTWTGGNELSPHFVRFRTIHARSV